MGQITENPTISTAERGGVLIAYLQVGAEPLAIFACLGDPNGAINSGRGSIAIDVLTGDAYIKTTGYISNNSWESLGGVGPAPTLIPDVLIAPCNVNGITLNGVNPVVHYVSTSPFGVGDLQVGLAANTGNFSNIATIGDIILLLYNQTTGNGRFIFNNSSQRPNAGTAFSFGPLAGDLLRFLISDGYNTIYEGSNVPTAIADASSYYTIDAAANDAQLYAINEQGKRFRITDQYRISSSVLSKVNSPPSDIPGCVFNVRNGETVHFRGKIRYTATSGAGVKATIGGTATVSFADFYGYALNTANDADGGSGFGQALGDQVATFTATSGGCIFIEGDLTFNAAGTLTLMFAQNVTNAGAASAVPAGAASFEIHSST